MLRILLISMLSFLIYSCESVVELDVNNIQPSLSVSSIFTSNTNNPNGRDNSFEVQLTESKAITSGNNTIFIDDAVVELYRDGYLLEQLTYDYDRDLYVSTETVVEQGFHYSFKVQHPDYEEVSGEAFVPFASQIGSTTPISKTGSPSPIEPNRSIEQVEMEIELEDPATVKNYYHVLFYHTLVNYQVLGLDTTLDYSTTRPFITNYNLNGNNEPEAILSTSSAELYGAFLTDQDFNGTTKTLNFSLQYPLNPAIQVADNIIVEVRTVTKDYYDFYTSAIRNAGIGSDPFSYTPTSVKSNIENGFGLFAGYSHQVKAIKLPR